MFQNFGQISTSSYQPQRDGNPRAFTASVTTVDVVVIIRKAARETHVAIDDADQLSLNHC